MDTDLVKSTEDRALSLLGQGIPSEAVASALGVSPARISQFLAVDTFADRVSALRYERLQSHNSRDEQYNELEDSLLKQLKESLPFIIKPSDILGAIKTINGAVRRGHTAPQAATANSLVVSLILPTQIVEKVITNPSNQVVSVGEQSLLTIQSGSLLKQVKEADTNDVAKNPELPRHQIQADSSL